MNQSAFASLYKAGPQLTYKIKNSRYENEKTQEIKTNLIVLHQHWLDHLHELVLALHPVCLHPKMVNSVVSLDLTDCPMPHLHVRHSLMEYKVFPPHPLRVSSEVELRTSSGR